MQEGGLPDLSLSVSHDPTFALGHAGLALLGHEYGADVDVESRLAAARLHARHATDRERSHVHAVVSHVAGNSQPLIAHLAEYPRDALLLSVAVPTIAFAGVTQVPSESWGIVERAARGYGGDWWYSGLLAFIRQEQRRWDEAMTLACASLDVEPSAGHSVHARAHVHYETGDHVGGRDWLDSWIDGPGRTADNLAHFSWHAGLHELSMGDFAAIRARYVDQLSPPTVVGCRAVVDSCSLLWRWAITPGAEDVPPVEGVLEAVDDRLLDTPSTPFMALHAAVTLCALGQGDRLGRLDEWSRRQADPTYREVVAPLCAALRALAEADPATAADRLTVLLGRIWRLGGSDAQREVVEDTLIAALLAAGRYERAVVLLDERLDRRASPRDVAFRRLAVAPAS